MANRILKYVLVKSSLPTAKEPYNGQFVSNGTIDLDRFAEKVCAGRTNIDAPTLKLILRTAFTHIVEDMAENVFRYQTGFLAFEPAIAGSLPSMDAKLGEENSLYVAVRLANGFAGEVAALVPMRDTEDAIGVKIDDVLDVAADKRQQVTGRGKFQVTGKNISAKREGERVEIMDCDGVVHACSVVEDDGMGQRIVAEAVSDPKAGKGVVLLTTRGYATPDSDPTTVKKQVTVVAGEVPPVTSPTLTKAYPYPHDGEAEYENGLIEGAVTYLHGENLVDITSLSLTYMSTADGMEHTKTIPVESYDVEGGNLITIGGGFWADGWGDVWDRVAEVTFEVKTTMGSATLKAHDKS